MLKSLTQLIYLPPAKIGTDADTIKHFRLSLHLMLIAFVATVVYCITFFVNGEYSTLAMSLAYAFSYFVCLYFTKRGDLKFSKNLFFSMVNINLFIGAMQAGPDAGIQYYFFPLAAGSYIMFLESERKTKILFSAISAVLFTLCCTLEIPSEYHTHTILGKYATIFEAANELISMIIMVYCIYYFNHHNRKINKELSNQKASLYSIVENINEAVCQIDTEYKIVQFNQQFGDIIIMLNGTPVQTGQELFSLIDFKTLNIDNPRENWEFYFNRVVSHEKICFEESITVGEAKMVLEIHLNPVIENERVIGTLIIAKDITSRRQQEEALKISLEQNKTLALVASSMQYGVIICDKDLKIQWANESFRTRTGYEPKEYKNHQIAELLDGNLSDKITRTTFNNLLQDGKPFTLEIIQYCKNQEPFWAYYNVSPLLDENENIIRYIFILSDITAQKQADEELQKLLQHSQKLNQQLQDRDRDLQETIRQLNKQGWELQLSKEHLVRNKEKLEKTNLDLSAQALLLEQQYKEVAEKNLDLEQARTALSLKAEQLEASSRYKSEFLANMSHELRTPLNSIIILSRLLSENKEQNLSPKQQEFAKVVNKSSTDLLNLINDILDLSKIEAGKIELEQEEFPVLDLAEDLQNMFNELAVQKKIQFSIQNNLKPDQMMCSDRLRISQILKNLLSNAFKFTPVNGKVQLQIHAKGTEEINFSVLDTGIGIDPKKHQLIFESFQQVDGSTSRKYGGTGLGLSICKELTQLLQGEILLESQPSEGSKFTVSLPANTTVQEGSSPSNVSESSKRVLIIEDDESFAKMLEKMALSQGCITEVCYRGDTGYMRIQEWKPDAILLDLGLPGMDGKSILQKLRKDPLLNKIPVHVVSATKASGKEEFLPVISWVEKPASLSDLKSLISRVKSGTLKTTDKVLVIEDSPEQGAVIRQMLSRNHISCTIAETGKNALESINKETYDCIILDLNLPDSDGLELLKQFKEDPRMSTVPVIVYSARELTDTDKSRLRDYASSYIRKEAETTESLIEETRSFLDFITEQRNRRKADVRCEFNAEYLKGKKIMLVDDDQRNIYSISAMLERFDVNLVTAFNGKEAISTLESNPDVDMVLMDVMMPEMDGYEATRYIRKQSRFKELPIIALTAKAMVGDRDHSIEAGMNDHITKPINNNELIRVINNYFG